MRENPTVGGTGNYESFEDLLITFKAVSKRLPKGVRLKRERNKYLQFQITMPGTGNRKSKPTGESFTDTGIYAALDKAWKIRKSLDEFTGETEFWEWYDKEILGKNILVDDRITYREIFEKIEQEYWEGRNKNTGRERDRNLANDNASIGDYYGFLFRKFPNWDKQPNWEEIKTVLFTWEQGTKTFKDRYTVIKKICSYCPNSDKLLGLLAEIDGRQTKFRNHQSISLNQFLEWRQRTLDNAPTNSQLEIREKWLWVCSMCVVYGLRPSEIAAALNLTKPYTKDNLTIPALSKKDNKYLLLVLGDKTYFGTTIKTGSRVCRPLVNDKKLIEELQIQVPKLPLYEPSSENHESIVRGFSKQIAQRIKSWKCPVTQVYAFRYLGNHLGELHGIPQEIRSRSLGHTNAVNDLFYRKHTNFETSVDLLTKHAKQPLDYQTACNQLQDLGFDLNDNSVRAILRVIYQLEK
ncbi:MAG: hypothetical protein QNJ51_03010 [Calothrix sp. MO_167.B12]|nr:hypothetical protein [Calothrix sp. MO_167.B12]